MRGARVASATALWRCGRLGRATTASAASTAVRSYASAVNGTTVPRFFVDTASQGRINAVAQLLRRSLSSAAGGNAAVAKGVAVELPALRESTEEPTLRAWTKKEGDYVKAGEPLCELEFEDVVIQFDSQVRASMYM